MAKIKKWLPVMLIPLLGLTITSCGSEDDEPDNNENKGKEVYSFFNTQNFSKKWMVSEIKINGKIRDTFEYDSKNRPIAIGGLREEPYTYNDTENSCTFTESWGDTYTGYFEGSKMIKAEWDDYTITNVKYDGGHLVRGSNRYILTWDSNGNITNYSDCGMSFTYTEIPNKTNIDFNMMLEGNLADCWDDDGSNRFTVFGWTGARTTNLIASCRYTDSTTHREYTYKLDDIGRPIEIQEVGSNNVPIIYTISYVED